MSPPHKKAKNYKQKKNIVKNVTLHLLQLITSGSMLKVTIPLDQSAGSTALYIIKGLFILRNAVKTQKNAVCGLLGDLENNRTTSEA